MTTGMRERQRRSFGEFRVILDGWTYGENAPQPRTEGQKEAANVTYTYSDAEDGIYLPDKPTKAGSYWIKAEIDQSHNYHSAVAKAPFVIAKADYPDQIPETTMTIGRRVKTLQDVALDLAGWRWEEPSAKIDGDIVRAYAVYSDIENYVNYRIEITLSKEAPKDVSALTVALEAATLIYDGTEKTPKIVAEDGDLPLVPGTDYDVQYQNNKFAGQGKAIATFKNDYRGVKELVFTILQAEKPDVNTTIRCDKKIAKLSDLSLPDGFVWEDENIEVHGRRFTAKALYQGEDASSYKTTELTFVIIMEEEPVRSEQGNTVWLAVGIPVAVLTTAAIAFVIAQKRKKR